jgi:DNA invertase Pin-like site-specific DNA recombinase
VKYGYARVSTTDQHLDGQETRLQEAGCEQVFADTASGTKASRPEWDKLFMQLREGDTLVVCKLDRLGRSLINLVDVINELGERKTQLVILDLGIDTSTNNGRLIFSIMSALAEWEARIISERTIEGLAAARERHGGKLPARGPKMKPDQIALAKRLMAERETSGMSATRIAELVGVSRATLYRAVREDGP